MDAPSADEANDIVVRCSGTAAETVERMDLITAVDHGE